MFRVWWSIALNELDRGHLIWHAGCLIDGWRISLLLSLIVLNLGIKGLCKGSIDIWVFGEILDDEVDGK